MSGHHPAPRRLLSGQRSRARRAGRNAWMLFDYYMLKGNQAAGTAFASTTNIGSYEVRVEDYH
jgi:hypothetical protein